MSRVLISDKLSPSAVDVFNSHGIDVDIKVGMTAYQLLESIDKYDGLAVRSATNVDASLLMAGHRLRVVGRAGIGIDNINLTAATKQGILVMNTPFGNSITTAEHTIALLLSLCRQIPKADSSVRQGKWEKANFMGVEVSGKVLGLVGCGNIGSIVADRAQGLKMKVLVYDPFVTNEQARDLGVEKVDFDDLLTRSDIVSLHVPLTETTRGMIDASVMEKMRPGVRIINCARGGLIVERDLKSAIRGGQVAGAALDVFENEPPEDPDLLELREVIVTPHLGASTNEAQENVAIQLAEQMSNYLLTGSVTNALNMASLTPEEAPRLAPYMPLVKQLGSFAGQVIEEGVREIVIEYAGAAASLNTKPLTAALLEAILSPSLESVNMVNAPFVAKDRNIEVVEVKRESPCDYNSMVRLTIEAESHTGSFGGTLFGGRPRLTQIDGINIEAELGSYMLFVRNHDKPGFIGSFGGVLGQAGVNIATFHLGRGAVGGEAIALIEVDQPVTEDILQQVTFLPNVVQVKPLSFDQSV